MERDSRDLDKEHVRYRLPEADAGTVDRIGNRIHEMLEHERAVVGTAIMSNDAGSVRVRPHENNPNSCNVEFYQRDGHSVTAPHAVKELMREMFQEEYRKRAK